uniref:GAG-pre-integrase domain-containing protein n=1 Tax=Cajanus cajan TaxID=3821 RepID=A0A151S2Y1_CAJCA|nr:hypothetical protein KK1_029146 [Cajanus cajan]
MKMIGSAEALDGLYFMQVSKHQTQANLAEATSSSFPNTALWHFRLGHISFSKMNQMIALYPYLQNSNKRHICDICHFARQRRLPYSDSLHNASKPFDLLHLDVWGPLKPNPYRIINIS